MHRVMKYCVNTAMKGLTLNPDETLNGDKKIEFTICGISGFNSATCPGTGRSISGWAVFLCGASVTMKSGMKKIIALSVTEAELFSGTQCAQDMLYLMHIIEGMELKVKKAHEIETE